MVYQKVYILNVIGGIFYQHLPYYQKKKLEKYAIWKFKKKQDLVFKKYISSYN